VPSEALDLVEQMLLDPLPDYPQYRKALAGTQAGRQGRPTIIASTAVRLADALAALRESPPPGNAADAVVLLRQIVRWTYPLAVRQELWSILRCLAEEAGLVGSERGPGQVQVIALPWKPWWLKGTEAIDVLARRRTDDEAPGDGMLAAMSRAAGLGWKTYQSAAQKAAVDCWTFAAPGSTTLVTLPTGGGKSLCALLPPWLATRGGRHSQGTTLVVVPTVALALDQERQARRFFPEAAGEYSLPISRTGDTTAEERREIEAALRDGRLPLIYTSPESLLGSRLYDVCLDAARAGLITRFVIDEAHLIASWGAGFRPEFQLLGTYRRKLLEASGGQLRTLLLSATVADNGREIIERHFAERGRLVVVQANRLRPEIGYWFHFARTAGARRQRVLEALPFLPRPLILYVTRPDQATEWERLLLARGYRRLASFSGETNAETRRQLIRAWDANELDIMVATSAFGLGVDKSDIRSVVHGTLPENIDRFYQEVGRSGRDGWSAMSLVCATDDGGGPESDIDLAYSLQSRIITIEKALPRWQGMLATARVAGDVRWIDRDATPEGRPEIGRSERNREWNDHVLLLMQRARLIEVADAPPPRQGEDGALLYHLPVRILDPEVFNNPAEVMARIEPHRQRERTEAQAAARGIVDLVTDYASDDGEECLSSRFAALYADVQRACGGCPPCRREGCEPSCEPLGFSVEYPPALARAVAPLDEIDPVLRRILGRPPSLIATWSGPRGVAALSARVALVAQLVHSGFQQVIYPAAWLEDPEVRDELAMTLADPGPQRQPRPHRLVPDRWVVRNRYPLFELPTVIAYPPEDAAADRLYGALENASTHGIIFPATIHLVHEALYLPTPGRRFVEHVDGLTEPADRLQRLLEGSEKLPEFF